MLKTKDYYLLLSTFIPIGPMRARLLIKYFGSIAKLFSATKKELLEVGLKEDMVINFLNHFENFDLVKYKQRLEKLNINYLYHEEIEYPSKLKGIEDYPLHIYYQGNFPKDMNTLISIVGARKMTAYGREVVEKIVGFLASYGVGVVSGLARGIDSVAHKSSIENDVPTIAVLPCGLDVIYPPENVSLAKKIVEKGGVVISEYPLGYPARRENFVSRNRIVSGISNAVVVVEGEIKSGTLLTASHAANQGKTVFAVPGQITSPNSAAPHFLIQNGAKILFDPKDILDELNLEVTNQNRTIFDSIPEGKIEEKIYNILENEPFHVDEIVRISGCGVRDVSSKIIIMELKGLIKNTGNGIYKRT